MHSESGGSDNNSETSISRSSLDPETGTQRPTSFPIIRMYHEILRTFQRGIFGLLLRVHPIYPIQRIPKFSLGHHYTQWVVLSYPPLSNWISINTINGPVAVVDTLLYCACPIGGMLLARWVPCMLGVCLKVVVSCSSLRLPPPAEHFYGENHVIS